MQLRHLEATLLLVLFAACSTGSTMDAGGPDVDPGVAEEQPTTSSVAATRSDPLPNGGILAVTSEMVGAEGAVLQLNDVMLSIPPGAVSGSVQLTLKEAKQVTAEGGKPGSPLYLLEPSNMLFLQPVTLRIPFTGDPSNAVVLWWDESQRDAFPITPDNFDGEFVTVSNTHASKIGAVFDLLELGLAGYELYENIQDLRFPCGEDSGKVLIDGYCYSCPGGEEPVKSGGSVICCATGTIALNGQCHSCPTGTPFTSAGQVMCCPGTVSNNQCQAMCPATAPVAYPRPSPLTGLWCCPSGTQGINASGNCLSCPTAGYTLCGTTSCCSPTAVCNNGTCQAPPASCTAPNVACGGGCVNPFSNKSHCGQCNRACSGTQSCVNGACTDAPDLLWLDASNVSSFVKNASGAVTSWRDQSSRQLLFAVGSDAAPQWSATGGPANKAHLSFTTGTTRLTSPSVASSPQMTLFVVYKMNASPPSWATVLAQGNDTYFALRQSNLGAANGQLNFHIANNNDAPAIPLQFDTWRLVTAVQSATTTTLYPTPSLASTTTQGAIASGSAALNLGNSSVNSQQLNGSIAEIRMYGSALTVEQRAPIEAALRAKWGLPMPYSIGGSVSGLSGSVVLTNGANSITVTQNGAFTFTAPVASGGTYAVAVANQPAGQNCVVASGSGTVSSANVTNVTVTCTSTPRAIGGTLSGLVGTVVLRNNGGNDLTLTQSGSFTFTQPVAVGAAYAVSIATQPVGQTCAVANGTGTQGTQGVTNVAITCVSNRYGVGGTLTGLVGSVVLQNNAGDNLTLTASGAFRFNQTVAFGASYAVTVLVQPSGQTCTVASGTGTQAAADTTSVAVNCTNNNYTIGGAVSGLSGTLVLLNAGTTHSVTANGSFTFAQARPFGSAYAVTVQTQPAGQTCVVASGSGTVGPANVINVSVTCTNLTYSIGGTVSGLSGTVVLQQGGGNNLSVTQNGSFTFSQAVAFGAPYAVTVLTQPVGQTCVVASGTGTMGAANVTTVSVSCANGSYSIGGSVTGLNGTVVLQNNGGDNRTITTNGAFTFSQPLLFSSSYAVTVLTQPVGQACAVGSGSGTVGAANVTTISVTCTNLTYSVGGTVSGLNGTLVLQQGGANPLSLTQNGSFTFSQPVSFGATYAVTIQTQPAGQTCAVTSGAGTMGAANVTTVAVTCTNNPYTVGGSVGGLSGTVVLQNNGGDSRSLAANGAFTFSQALPFSSSYAVTVLSQPAGQTCSVTAGSGVVGAGNVTTVSVTCVNITYTLGGAVSGLTGGTLELRQNGGNNLSVTANGSFTFSQPVAFGTVYAVTVFTQPAGLVCSVANSSGTMGAGNVTNLSVTCSANSYTVGGTTTGLNGTLVLRNNGSDNLTLTTNGVFAFSQAVAFGGAYAVTVFSQPSLQTCTVGAGSGTVGAGNVTNVTVTCVTNYTLGGTVTGLPANATLELRNNGGDALTIANGAFTFSQTATTGAGFAVTVPSQPARQNCVLANGSGTIGTANVTNVSVTCAATAKLFFVTSTSTIPSFSGTMGGDGYCQTRAQQAGLSGTYLAWLGDINGADPLSRSTRASVPYVRRDNVQLAANWTGLVSGALQAPPNVTETNVTYNGNVWTAVGANGALVGDRVSNCNGWTAFTNPYSGRFGVSSATDATWTASGATPCNTTTQYPLYCIEQ